MPISVRLASAREGCAVRVTIEMALVLLLPRLRVGSALTLLLLLLLLLLMAYTAHHHVRISRTGGNGEALDPRHVALHQTPHVLFFNRVPKCGSEMLVLLLQWLQARNGFRHVRLKNSVRRYLTRDEQAALVEEVGERLQESPEPRVSFDRHVYFTNFSNHGFKMPLYLNLVRDPVEKVASRFYYARVTPRPGAATPPGYTRPAPPRYTSLEECLQHHDPECTFLPGHMYDLTIPYFCGHKEFCRELNNEAALREAKRQVEAWFPVVGILEEVNVTLAVLQHRLPHYFAGVLDLYHNDLLAAPHYNMNQQRPPTSPEVEAALRTNISLEYDFYNFLKQRLVKQYLELPVT
ncbi:heparan sulfate 2-O-sulfotransferase pipe-like isoform X1 [Eriocheir sinensis]|uniref:heparan sulfate 2-O-sulfotransferase pipe-like isoform X1 n=1 Tax=Eriocheir sinensis TaxID=95602 RepID=UPI0021C95037|nr:heparan sulfate 2-O-sulfotransferase pipe-like isoform X1 [Eriocheir sinensis]